ncbi:MAG: 4-hydroxythreonine-4-phosphate dehydrogenase PdxA [Gemmatimonadetes bacterium]|nr:4-hydroxythreonine-4-phosphate dehydrogenase PdxA [Gemmatimonadota bacterium]
MRLAITLGDPRGIGPEIVGKALADPAVRALGVTWRVYGPRGTTAPVDVDVGEWAPSADGAETERVARAGLLAGRAVEQAARDALAGVVDGLVTAPLDKAALLAGGYADPGHTELLGRLAGCPTTMMLASDRLRVVLATTHIALREVPDAVTHAALVQAAEATRAGLQRDFGIVAPRLALCALNPHGGDGGRFGDEDARVLAPAAQAGGMAGPFPADTVFVRALRGEFDAVIAPYHDVGMTAIKVASFGEAVNVTLGLPFVRTSPDHGTALDIAGQGIADPSSMIAAMTLAASLVSRRAGRVPDRSSPSP